jgi:hypothetical protein
VLAATGADDESRSTTRSPRARASRPASQAWRQGASVARPVVAGSRLPGRHAGAPAGRDLNGLQAAATAAEQEQHQQHDDDDQQQGTEPHLASLPVGGGLPARLPG